MAKEKDTDTKAIRVSSKTAKLFDAVYNVQNKKHVAEGDGSNLPKHLCLEEPLEKFLDDEMDKK